jgi:hypothetical protein
VKPAIDHWLDNHGEWVAAISAVLLFTISAKWI